MGCSSVAHVDIQFHKVAHAVCCVRTLQRAVTECVAATSPGMRMLWSSLQTGTGSFDCTLVGVAQMRFCDVVQPLPTDPKRQRVTNLRFVYAGHRTMPRDPHTRREASSRAARRTLVRFGLTCVATRRLTAHLCRRLAVHCMARAAGCLSTAVPRWRMSDKCCGCCLSSAPPPHTSASTMRRWATCMSSRCACPRHHTRVGWRCPSSSFRDVAFVMRVPSRGRPLSGGEATIDGCVALDSQVGGISSPGCMLVVPLTYVPSQRHCGGQHTICPIQGYKLAQQATTSSTV